MVTFHKDPDCLWSFCIFQWMLTIIWWSLMCVHLYQSIYIKNHIGNYMFLLALRDVSVCMNCKLYSCYASWKMYILNWWLFHRDSGDRAFQTRMVVSICCICWCYLGRLWIARCVYIYIYIDIPDIDSIYYVWYVIYHTWVDILWSHPLTWWWPQRPGRCAVSHRLRKVTRTAAVDEKRQ